MRRMVLPFSAALAASIASPEDAAMRYPSPVSETATGMPGTPASDDHRSAAPVARRMIDRDQAAQGPIPAPVSAAANPAPNRPADSPAEARGRRTLSTAFVRVGPDGHLTVELHDGRVLVLRDVVMRPKEYCGMRVLGGPPDRRFCGGYADVAAARPGGAPASGGRASAVPKPIG